MSFSNSINKQSQIRHNLLEAKNELQKSMEKLSTGVRLNSASDNVASTAIAFNFETKIKSLQASLKNLSQNISITQIAQSALEEVASLLQRMREIKLQSINDTNTKTDKKYLNQEVLQLTKQIDKILSTTEFNGKSILNTSFLTKKHNVEIDEFENFKINSSKLSALSSEPTAGISDTEQNEFLSLYEVGRLKFSESDNYSFSIKDNETGLTFQSPALILSADEQIIDSSSGRLNLSMINSYSATPIIFSNGHNFKTGDLLEINDIELVFNPSENYAIALSDTELFFADSHVNAMNGIQTPISYAYGNPTVSGQGFSLNIENENSKSNFEKFINEGLEKSTAKTSIQSKYQIPKRFYEEADLHIDIDKLGKEDFKFRVSIDGVSKDINFKNRFEEYISDEQYSVVSGNWGGQGPRKEFFVQELGTVMSRELQINFDDSVFVKPIGWGLFELTDAKGRSIEISQGEGSGYFFGTDNQNGGSLFVEGNQKNNISVKWDDNGEELIIYHANGGSFQIQDVSSEGAGKITLSTSSIENSEIRTSTYTLRDDATDTNAKFTGLVEPSELILNFSNLFGYADDRVSQTADTSILKSTYGLKITDGGGNHYINFSANDLLDIQSYNNTDAEIEAAIRENLENQILVGANGGSFNDNQVNASEFQITYREGNLKIINNVGRNLAVEDFNSEYGFVEVYNSSLNSFSETLSSKKAHVSELRLEKGWASDVSLEVSAYDAPLRFSLNDGMTFTAYLDNVFTIDVAVDWPAAFYFEAAIQSAADADTNLRVSFDEKTNEFVIIDLLGREIEMKNFEASGDRGIDTSGQGSLLNTTSTIGFSNQNINVKTQTENISQGKLNEITQVKLDFNQRDASEFILGLNGQVSSAVDFNFANEGFNGSNLEQSLDNLFDRLNRDYKDTPFNYSYDKKQNALIVRNMRGGELYFDGHSTSSDNFEMIATAISGQMNNADIKLSKNTSVIKYEEQLEFVQIDKQLDLIKQNNKTISVKHPLDKNNLTHNMNGELSLNQIDDFLANTIANQIEFGVAQNRISLMINNTFNEENKTKIALGRLKDTDYSFEVSRLVKEQLVVQSSVSMLAQANQLNKNILILLNL